MTDVISILDENLDVIQFKQELSGHKNTKIFALNYFAHKILENNEVCHELGDQCLSDDDKVLIDDKSINITTNWYNDHRLKPYLVYHDVNLGSLIELELFQYLLSIYRKAVSIIKIVEKENPKTVIASTNINEFLETFCKEKNIKTILLQKQKTDSMYFDVVNIKYNLGPFPISVALSRNNYLRLKNIVDGIAKLFFRSESYDKLKHKKSILLLDFNPVSYRTLLTELSKLDKNIVLLNQRRPAIWNIASLKVIKETKSIVLNLNSFEKSCQNTIIAETSILLEKLNKMFELNDVFVGLFALDSFDLWRSIKTTFFTTCMSRFSESLRRIILAEHLFDRFDMSVILEWAETGQEEKEIITLSKKKTIPSILLQHGMYPNSPTWNKFARFLAYFSYPFISDKQAVWGKLTKSFAVEHNHNEKDIVIVGSPRHDDFFNFKKTIKNKGTILFATTSASGIFTEGSTSDVHIKFENFVKEVCRVAKKLDKQLVIKPHPQPDSINNIIELIKKIDDKIPIILETDLKELISSCELLITFNNSTIALESIILGKPTISLQIEKWAEESQIAKMNAVLSITKEQDIEEGIKQIIYDNNLRHKISLNGKTFLDLYMSNQGSASSHLAKILGSL